LFKRFFGLSFDQGLTILIFQARRASCGVFSAKLYLLDPNTLTRHTNHSVSPRKCLVQATENSANLLKISRPLSGAVTSHWTSERVISECYNLPQEQARQVIKKLAWVLNALPENFGSHLVFSISLF